MKNIILIKVCHISSNITMSDVQFGGSINLVLGNMFSGKTTELVKRYKRYILSGKSCIMIKYINDIRYDENMVVTHDNIKIEAIPCTLLSEVNEIVKKYDVVCIDEVQFYADAHIFCDKWANQGKIVEASGLSGTFNRTPFYVVSRLIPLAETLVMLDAICVQTGKRGSFTKLTVENITGGIEIIGGADKYLPVDRKTYFNNDMDECKSIMLNEMIDFYKCDNNILQIQKIKENIKNDNYE